MYNVKKRAWRIHNSFVFARLLLQLQSMLSFCIVTLLTAINQIIKWVMAMADETLYQNPIRIQVNRTFAVATCRAKEKMLSNR